MSQYFTIQDFCEHFKISRDHYNRMKRKFDIKVMVLGPKAHRIPLSEVTRVEMLLQGKPPELVEAVANATDADRFDWHQESLFDEDGGRSFEDFMGDRVAGSPGAAAARDAAGSGMQQAAKRGRKPAKREEGVPWSDSHRPKRGKPGFELYQKLVHISDVEVLHEAGLADMSDFAPMTSDGLVAGVWCDLPEGMTMTNFRWRFRKSCKLV